MNLNNSEILAVCKILLDSRAFTKIEMSDILDNLIACCVPKENQKIVNELIGNEKFHYIEPRHKTKFIDTMWSIGQAIQHCQYIEIDYFRLKDKSIVKRKVKPAAIMFSEYYFYLTAFIDDKEVQENFDVINDSFPTIYRIDRIKNLRVMARYFVGSRQIDQTYVLELMTYLRHYVPKTSGNAEIEYTLNDKTETMKLDRYSGYTLRFGEEQLKNANFKVISGSVNCTAYYTGLLTEQQPQPNIEIKKTVTSLSGGWSPGALIKVTLVISDTQNNFYSIEDVIPSCARFAYSESNNYVSRT